MATGAMRMSSEQKPGQGIQTVMVELRLTEEQEEYLEQQFKKTKNPHPSELILVAAETGLLEEEVEAWFKQRMAMWRRDQGLNPVSSRIC